MPVKRRFVQGTYITWEAREAIRKEALKRNLFATTLASEVLEEKAKEWMKKGKKHDKNLQD